MTNQFLFCSLSWSIFKLESTFLFFFLNFIPLFFKLRRLEYPRCHIGSKLDLKTFKTKLITITFLDSFTSHLFNSVFSHNIKLFFSNKIFTVFCLLYSYKALSSLTESNHFCWCNMEDFKSFTWVFNFYLQIL